MYLWIKTLHIVAVMSWMAGLLYLPRLFVYHADTELNTPQDLTFRIMERRLMNAIMMPAMIVSLFSGGYLAIQGGFLHDLWLQLKVFFIFVLMTSHFFLHYHMRMFQIGKNTFSSRYYRFINEAPTLLMIVVVALVVLKPV